MTVHRFVRPDEHLVEDVGSGIRLLHYVDGDVRVEHECGRWIDVEETDGLFVKVIAPCLSAAHLIPARRPTTITPSISCPSCGLHGHVTAGVWAGVPTTA